MQILHNWLVTLVGAVLITNLLEMLLPESQLQKFVRVILGIFITITILNPLFSLIHQNIDFEHIMLKASGQGMDNVEDILAQGNALKQVAGSIADEQYAQGLNRQVRALALLVNGVADAKATVKLSKKSEGGSNGIEKIEVLLKTKGLFANQGTGLVKPVKVKIAPDENTKEQEKTDKEQQRREKAVQETITNFYNLAAKQVEAHIID